MRRLIIFVYSFNKTSQVFSHQIDVALALAELYDQTVIFADDVGVEERNTYENSPHSNAKIVLIETLINQSTSPLHRFVALAHIFRSLNSVSANSVFYFMTETYAMVFGLYFRVRHVRQILWYAHAHKSLRLFISSRFMDLVCSSTEGSMPIKSQKVRLIGQMVDPRLFPFAPKEILKDVTLIHIGRFDKSKSLHKIMQATESLIARNPKLQLHVIGSPSNEIAENYRKEVIREFANCISENKIRIDDALPRDKLHQHLQKSDIFIHAFQGSLDKTLIEATMSGLPVATINLEYLSEFGCWSNWAAYLSVQSDKFLEMEIDAILLLNFRALKKELERRRDLALSKHSLSIWLGHMSEVLRSTPGSPL